MGKKKWILTVFLTAALIMGGCGSAESSSTAKPQTPKITPVGKEYVTDIEISTNADGVRQAVEYLFAMDTEMMLEAFGREAEEAVRAAGEEVLRIDQLLSVGIENSDIARLNREGEAEVEELTKELICRALAISEDVGGAFDITVYPLMEAWGFPSGNYRIPDSTELENLLANVGPDKVKVGADGRISLAEGTRIDLGGIAKGYTSSRLMEIFASYDVDAALVTLGGNVQTYGKKTNGRDWNIAIQKPEKDGEYLGVLSCHDLAVITSGGYERYFEEDGKTYHHILDPESGCPASAGAKSVTIVSGDGALADALSTALFVLGPERTAAYWQENPGDFGFILQKDDGSLLVTEDLAESFSTELPMETVLRKE